MMLLEARETITEIAAVGFHVVEQSLPLLKCHVTTRLRKPTMDDTSYRTIGYLG